MAFYVTQVRDSKFRKVAGPFTTKGEAEAAVKPAKEQVILRDAWSHFDSFGVTHIEDQFRLPRIRDQ
jgi:hypothetical protein